MKARKLKWYSPLLLLFGAILSFADPLTDILTLVKFYLADQKIWFVVGLTSVILPCLVFPIIYSVFKDRALSQYSDSRKCAQVFLCGFHPFSCALVRLQGFVYFLKKWLRSSEIVPAGITLANSVDADDLVTHIDFAVLFESVVESAPQFIIQLYAASVQEEPVEVIQIISLPVSFLSLTWAFTIADEIIHEGHIIPLKIRHKLALFVTHSFLLSSRLFAICYFAVGYKWLVLVVLSFHTLVIVVADNIRYCQKGSYWVHFGFGSVFFVCVHWLRDDLAGQQAEDDDFDTGNRKSRVLRMQLFSNVLFVLENLMMIMLFYFSERSNTWYSLPVTVCVCLLGVMGAVIRITLFKFLLLLSNSDRYSDIENDSNCNETPELNNDDNSPDDGWYVTPTVWL